MCWVWLGQLSKTTKISLSKIGLLDQNRTGCTLYFLEQKLENLICYQMLCLAHVIYMTILHFNLGLLSKGSLYSEAIEVSIT